MFKLNHRRRYLALVAAALTTAGLAAYFSTAQASGVQPSPVRPFASAGPSSVNLHNAVLTLRSKPDSTRPACMRREQHRPTNLTGPRSSATTLQARPASRSSPITAERPSLRCPRFSPNHRWSSTRTRAERRSTLEKSGSSWLSGRPSPKSRSRGRTGQPPACR
jgi:hypothetical protein